MKLYTEHTWRGRHIPLLGIQSVYSKPLRKNSKKKNEEKDEDIVDEN